MNQTSQPPPEPASLYEFALSTASITNTVINVHISKTPVKKITFVITYLGLHNRGSGFVLFCFIKSLIFPPKNWLSCNVWKIMVNYGFFKKKRFLKTEIGHHCILAWSQGFMESSPVHSLMYLGRVTNLGVWEGTFMRRSGGIISKHRNICSFHTVCYRVQLGVPHSCRWGDNALYLKSAIQFPKHFWNITFNCKYTFSSVLSTVLLRRNDYSHV